MVKKIFIYTLLLSIIASLITLNYGINHVISLNVALFTSAFVLITSVLSYSKLLNNIEVNQHLSKFQIVLKSLKSILKIIAYVAFAFGFLLLKKYALLVILPYIIGILLSIIVVVVGINL
ncbi:MAG: Unknown protein [uncultured Campylobacterales bacterium]|uniref:Uncharacterized protein n=1 Tax=uncultured Campylobacterales bacterium TaxID=352960 RepID=A0A6S6TFG5_9BACT|nr:MAG: Unknown protein [uncultured Campylobacterales bacterium]